MPRRTRRNNHRRRADDTIRNTQAHFDRERPCWQRDSCWLDFGRIPENSELGRQAAAYIYMGMLGESYSPLMRILPPSYRMFQPPAVLYDSMIFVTEATPTKIGAA